MQSHHACLDRFGCGLAKVAIAALIFMLSSSAVPRAEDGTPGPEPAPRATTPGSDGAAFNFVLGSFVTAAGTDVAVSMYQIGRGTAREAAFGAMWQDSPVAFAATKSALTALFGYQLQRLHRTRPKAAFILGIAATSAEAALVARSAWIARQAGR